MKKKLIILTGVPGVGKSTVSSILYEDLDGCFYLEADKCGIMNPCILNEENIEILFKNISHVLNNYIKNTNSKNILLEDNISSKELLNRLIEIIDIDKIDLYKIILTCNEEEIKNRVQTSIEYGIGEEVDFKSLFSKTKTYASLEGYIIDTTKKTPKEVVDIIKDIIQ